MSDIIPFIYVGLACWWASILWQQRKWVKKPQQPSISVCDEVVLSCVRKLQDYEKWTGSEGFSIHTYRGIIVKGERFRVTITRVGEEAA